MGPPGPLHKVDFAAPRLSNGAMLAVIPFPDIGPEIFAIEIGGFGFALRWYAMAYIVGIIIGWRLAIAALRRPALWRDQTPPMTTDAFDDLLTWIILGIVIGGRLGFVLFYQPGYYLQNPLEIPMIWHGGMSFHGGFLGVLIATVVYCRRHGIKLVSAADLLAMGTPPGLLLGRIANFINAELWGRPTDAPWGVIFPGIAAQNCPGIEGPCARHPSQLYEAGLEGLLLGAVLIWLVFRMGALKRPGLVTGLFIAGYAAARGFVELFRQADAQFVSPDNPWGHVIRLGEAGLTMGQILSLPMLAVGLFLIWRAWTRPA